MIEKYLDKDLAKDIYMAGYITGRASEKRACVMAHSLEKNAGNGFAALKKTLAGVVGAGSGIFSGLLDAATKAPKALFHTAILGSSLGALGTVGADAIKERLVQEDPEEKFDNEISDMYKYKKRESEDAKWMTRVRALRDDLKKNYKKMSLDEYTTKYNALISALDERSK